MHKDGKVECAAAMRQLWDFLDEEMGPDKMAQMRQHIDECKRCVPHYDWEKAFLEALACVKPDCCAPSRLKQKLEEKLREAGFKAGAAR